MEIEPITSLDSRWKTVSEFAMSCSWRAGKLLAQEMIEGHFSDFERVFVAMDHNNIAGYCTIAKKDCILNVNYTPYIGYMFVHEKYRGNRLSQKLILQAMKYAKELGFEAIYLVSDHVNLYEKYGFEVIDKKLAYWGEEEKIYMHKL